AAVLFKTLYLSAAGNARLVADFLSLAGVFRYREAGERGRVVHWISLLIPVIALTLFLAFSEPKWMVVVGGFGQALTLPIIAGVTIWFRWTRLDRRIRPTAALDILLWIAFLSITAVATYAMVDQYRKAMAPPLPVTAPVEIPRTSGTAAQ
ncbi:MAG: hypothetical protein ACK58L_20875, partial [Planctomycetota bacterium]